MSGNETFALTAPERENLRKYLTYGGFILASPGTAAVRDDTLQERDPSLAGQLATLRGLTTGYLSQLERGAKRPSGPALALLHVIKRKGIEAIL
jgi:putative transcriptional regulator